MFGRGIHLNFSSAPDRTEIVNKFQIAGWNFACAWSKTFNGGIKRGICIIFYKLIFIFQFVGVLCESGCGPCEMPVRPASQTRNGDELVLGEYNFTRDQLRNICWKLSI